MAVDMDDGLESDEMRIPEDEACIFLHIIRASMAGPGERNCTHKDSIDGECCEPCPLEKGCEK